MLPNAFLRTANDPSGPSARSNARIRNASVAKPSKLGSFKSGIGGSSGGRGDRALHALQEGLQRVLPLAVPRRVFDVEEARKAFFAPYAGKPCPFLKHEVCSIYEHRPSFAACVTRSRTRPHLATTPRATWRRWTSPLP
ncbi:MAG: YkgJ family cysteine cluster protein [Betaproteobacteria bacterium]